MRQFCALLLLSLWTGFAAAPPPGDHPLGPVHWDAGAQTLNVEVQGWPLHRLLERLSQQTGWQVFLEPDTARTVTTRFSGRPVGEALQVLFGELSFALLPGDNGPSKLFVFRTNLKQATQRIAPDTEPKPISNELIVRLKPGANIDEIAKLLGAKVTGRSDELNLYRLEFEDEDAARRARAALEARDDVASVENNYEITRPAPVDPLALSRGLPLQLRPKAVGSADQVIIGLIDTAVQRTGGPLDAFLLTAISLAGEADISGKAPTHATAMLETIMRALSLNTPAGAESPVRILSVDVYGNNDVSSTYDVALGITKAINAGAMIINLSLGSPSATSYLEQVIQSGHEQGVLFLAAAGNEPVTTPTYPAAHPLVLAVTAGDRHGNVAPYANRGDFVDVVAPGSTVISYGGVNWYVAGTSAATAWASGFAASLASPGADYRQIGTTLRQALNAQNALRQPSAKR